MMADARVQAVRACAWQLAPLSLLTLVNFFNYLDRQIVYGMLSLIGDDFASVSYTHLTLPTILLV